MLGLARARPWCETDRSPGHRCWLWRAVPGRDRLALLGAVGGRYTSWPAGAYPALWCWRAPRPADALRSWRAGVHGPDRAWQSRRMLVGVQFASASFLLIHGICTVSAAPARRGRAATALGGAGRSRSSPSTPWPRSGVDFEARLEAAAPSRSDGVESVTVAWVPALERGSGPGFCCSPRSADCPPPRAGPQGFMARRGLSTSSGRSA